MKFRRVKGTRDVLPREAAARRELEEKVFNLLTPAGFKSVLTPTFEHYELYKRSTGESSDIVIKEMYRFQDMGGRDLALRPEGTPSVMRAVLENSIKLPARLWYVMPMFRQDKPQKGRYREHTQIGAEIIGEGDPQIDAELVKIGFDLFTSIGIGQMFIELNSIGCRECRPGYIQKLEDFLVQHADELCEDCRLRAQRNPLRVFDCKQKTCQRILSDAPLQTDHLCAECAHHFSQVKAGLDIFQIPYEENPRLVRGLDYYSRTVVEFKSRELGAQDTVCGGGRYDYLMQEMGGPATPAIGFAFGVERALLASGGEDVFSSVQPGIPLLLLPLGDEAKPYCLDLLFKLREEGIGVQAEFRSGGLSRQLKRANSRNAEKVLIVGDKEIESDSFIIRDMGTGKQEELTFDELISGLVNT